MAGKVERMQIRITSEMRKRCEQEAKKNEVTVAQIVRQALRKYLTPAVSKRVGQ